MTGRRPKRVPNEAAGQKPWELTVYVAGASLRSRTAIDNLNAICKEHVLCGCRIEVVDLLKKPQLARGDQIVAIPTVIRKFPLPMRRIIGDLSDTERVLVGLEMKAGQA